MKSDGVTTHYHDASAYAFNAPCWIASCKVDGRIVDTAELESEPHAIAWCVAQQARREGK